jgi:hypothetical protein
MAKIDIVSSTSTEGREKFLPYYLGNTAEEAETTYKDFLKLVETMANSYSRATSVPYEDYFGEAITGLARAKRDWDPSRGQCKFRNFAILKIKNALNECCRKNNSIVSVPDYIKKANRYINNIKAILYWYDSISRDDIRFIIITSNAYSPITEEVLLSDIEKIEVELSKFDRLSNNNEELFDRAEFIPSNEEYEEGITPNEAHDREQYYLGIMSTVSSLEERMTSEELHVARGIMAGKTYDEIGRSHIPQRSVAWVWSKLADMKEKFRGEYDLGE